MLPCAYHNCPHNTKTGGVTFFALPKDERRLIWIENSGNIELKQKANTVKNIVFCEKHFLIMDIKQCVYKKMLSKTAVPIPYHPGIIKSNVNHHQQQQQQQQQQQHHQPLHQQQQPVANFKQPVNPYNYQYNNNNNNNNNSSLNGNITKDQLNGNTILSPKKEPVGIMTTEPEIESSPSSSSTTSSSSSSFIINDQFYYESFSLDDNNSINNNNNNLNNNETKIEILDMKDW